MPNLFEALNTDLSSQQAGEAYHSQVDPLVKATTEVNKANVVDTAQQTAFNLAKDKAAKRTKLQNEIAGIKTKISNLKNQLLETDQELDELSKFNKPMSDEEIMRIGEQLNVPEVATNYINARSGRLNREFEAKKYDVAKDESKKTRKEDYEGNMRDLTSQIRTLNNDYRNATEVNKPNIQADIDKAQREVEVLDNKYKEEFGNSYLDSVKVDNTQPTSTKVENTTTDVDTNPGESTTTEVDTESIVPKGWGWHITESGLTTEDKKALQSDVAYAQQAIKDVTNSKSWTKAKNSVIADIKGGQDTWNPEKVKKALDEANAKAKAEDDARKAEANQAATDKVAFRKLYDRRATVLDDPDSNEKDKAVALAWMLDPDNQSKIKQYKLKQYGVN